MVKRLYKIHEVAVILDVSEDRVYSLAREGLLPHVRLGRQIRIDSDILDEFFKTGGKALPGGWKKEA